VNIIAEHCDDLHVVGKRSKLILTASYSCWDATGSNRLLTMWAAVEAHQLVLAHVLTRSESGVRTSATHVCMSNPTTREHVLRRCWHRLLLRDEGCGEDGHIHGSLGASAQGVAIDAQELKIHAGLPRIRRCRSPGSGMRTPWFVWRCFTSSSMTGCLPAG
jgi:hypothetical protein